MPEGEEFWIPLVDEPIGTIVARVQDENPRIADLVDTPDRLLAFRTFAYIRVGVLLGELLMEHDVPPYDGSETWVEALLREPAHRDAVTREIRAVAEEIAGERGRGEEEDVAPDEATRARFQEFARKRLGSA